MFSRFLRPQSWISLPFDARLDKLQPRITPSLVVFCGGLNLILIQWVLVRELTALLQGTELVILLTTIAYFVGLSIGYGLSQYVKKAWLKPLGTITLVLHLTLPIWFRLLVAGFHSIQGYWLAFVILPILTPFIVPAFYSVFLPLFADQKEEKLSKLYAFEVLGSGLAVLVLVEMGGFGLQGITAVYSIILLTILATLGMKRKRLFALVIASLAWIVCLPQVNYWSNALWFRELKGLPEGTITLFSGYSAYQKVDVLQAPDGTRYLYLDGLEHFGSKGGSWLNIIMGRIPASLLLPEKALVLGAGSMQMELMIANYAGHVTTVEIDPMVIDASTRYFTAYNHIDRLTNRTIVADDAKHFIANTDEHYDLIATDLPAPFSIQTAALYSEPFYQSIEDKLSSRGVFVVNLASTFEPDDIASRRIVASLMRTFDDVIVVTSGSAGWSFAYASNDLPFNIQDLIVALEASGESNFIIYDRRAVDLIAGNARPITLDTMDFVLKISADRIISRLR